MNEANRSNVSDQAREISFAVFRVCALIDQPVLRAALESAAVNLSLKSVSKTDESLTSINELEQLVRLAEVIGEIKALNSKVLIRELVSLKSAISQSMNNVTDIDLEVMFSKGKMDEGETRQDLSVDLVRQSKAQTDKIPERSEIIKFNRPSALETNQAGNRQSAILQFIKGLPNGCRMKDMIEKFPSVSERTLRNDLQALISVGSIERFGAIQGPFSYYRVKDRTFTKAFGDDSDSSDGRLTAPSGVVTKGGIIAL